MPDFAPQPGEHVAVRIGRLPERCAEVARARAETVTLIAVGQVARAELLRVGPDDLTVSFGRVRRRVPSASVMMLWPQATQKAAREQDGRQARRGLNEAIFRLSQDAVAYLGEPLRVYDRGSASTVETVQLYRLVCAAECWPVAAVPPGGAECVYVDRHGEEIYGRVAGRSGPLVRVTRTYEPSARHDSVLPAKVIGLRADDQALQERGRAAASTLRTHGVPVLSAQRATVLLDDHALLTVLNQTVLSPLAVARTSADEDLLLG